MRYLRVSRAIVRNHLHGIEISVLKMLCTSNLIACWISEQPDFGAIFPTARETS